MKEQLGKVGFDLTTEDKEKVKTSLTTLKRKLKTSTCRKCGEKINFAPDGNERIIPHNLDGTAHWQSCPYSGFTQKKAAPDIMKKLAVLFILKYGLNLEDEAGLTKRETQIVHATLEKIFKDETPVEKPKVIEENDGKVDDEVQFKPEPCDSVGDPDEERAPSEDLVHEAEVCIKSERNIDKGVEKVIATPITDPDALKIPKGTIVAEKK